MIPRHVQVGSTCDETRKLLTLQPHELILRLYITQQNHSHILYIKKSINEGHNGNIHCIVFFITLRISFLISKFKCHLKVNVLSTLVLWLINVVAIL